MQHISRLLTVLVGLLSVSLAQAALPEYYPDSYAAGGTIERIDIDTPAIVMNDQYLRLDPNVRVHTLRSPNQYLGALSVGQAIGIRFDDSRVVREIWVLPSTKNLLPPPPSGR